MGPMRPRAQAQSSDAASGGDGEPGAELPVFQEPCASLRKSRLSAFPYTCRQKPAAALGASAFQPHYWRHPPTQKSQLRWEGVWGFSPPLPVGSAPSLLRGLSWGQNHTSGDSRFGMN